MKKLIIATILVSMAVGLYAETYVSFQVKMTAENYTKLITALDYVSPVPVDPNDGVPLINPQLHRRLTFYAVVKNVVYRLLNEKKRKEHNAIFVPVIPDDKPFMEDE